MITPSDLANRLFTFGSPFALAGIEWCLLDDGRFAGEVVNEPVIAFGGDSDAEPTAGSIDSCQMSRADELLDDVARAAEKLHSLLVSDHLEKGSGVALWVKCIEELLDLFRCDFRVETEDIPEGCFGEVVHDILLLMEGSLSAVHIVCETMDSVMNPSSNKRRVDS